MHQTNDAHFARTVEYESPFALPDEKRGSAYVLGVPGHGKSVLLAHLIRQSIRTGAGCLVIDPHVSLVEYLLYSTDTRTDDIVWLDFRDTASPVGLNLCELPEGWDELALSRLVSSGVHIFELQWGLDGREGFGWGPRMAQLFRMSIGTLALAKLTVAEFLPLLLEKEFRERVVGKLPRGEFRAFWEQEFATLRGNTSEVIGPVTNKVRPWVTFEFVRNIIGQGRTTVPIARLMEEGKIILAPIPPGVLGRDAASLLGSILVSQVLNAAMERQHSPRQAYRPFHVYADEFQLVASRDVEELITQGRKFGIAVIAAHQVREQLPDVCREGTLAMQNQFYGRLTGTDAAEIAQSLDRTPPPGKRVPRQRLMFERGEWIPERMGVHWRDSRPIYDMEEGNRRTFRDVGDERANALVTLPPYEFIARVRQGKHYLQEHIRVEPAPRWDEEPGDEAKARAEAIREASRRRYGTDARSVREEISRRRGPDEPGSSRAPAGPNPNEPAPVFDPSPHPKMPKRRIPMK
jgi:hypothetical protein